MLSRATFQPRGICDKPKKQTKKIKLFPVISAIIFDCFYYCCEINLLSCRHIYFHYIIQYFVHVYVVRKKKNKSDHSEPLVATTTTKAHALYTVYMYFSPYCIHRRDTTYWTNSCAATAQRKLWTKWAIHTWHEGESFCRANDKGDPKSVTLPLLQNHVQ